MSLKQKLEQNTYKIRYSIDMAKDIVNTIDFAHKGSHPTEGRLEFAYAQTLEDWPKIFEGHELPLSIPQEKLSKRRHWLLVLLENSENSLSGKTLANQTE